MTGPCCAATPSRVCLPPEPGARLARRRLLRRCPWRRRAGGPQDAAPDRRPCPGTGGRHARRPGSTLKPLVLRRLMDRGRLRAGDTLSLPRRSAPPGRSFACTHPPTARSRDRAHRHRLFVQLLCGAFRGALYRRELTRAIEQWGLASRTDWFGDSEAAGGCGARRPALQALGEDGVLVDSRIARRWPTAAWRSRRGSARARRDGGRRRVRHRAARARRGHEGRGQDGQRAHTGGASTWPGSPASRTRPWSR